MAWLGFEGSKFCVDFPSHPRLPPLFLGGLGVSIFLRDGGRRGEAGQVLGVFSFSGSWMKEGVEESAALLWLYTSVDLFSPFCFWYIFDLILHL